MSPQTLSGIFLGVVCPMANEGEESVTFVQAVLNQCSQFRQTIFFAVLDTVSHDNTRELLDRLAESEPRLQVVWAPENRCVVDAYVRGYRAALAAGCDWILEIDAGFSHQPDEIPQFFARMSQGYDCVFGSRFAAGGEMRGPWKRRLVSRSGTILARLLLGAKLSDMTSGFELFSRRALEMVLNRGIHSRAHFFQTEIKTYCRNLRIAEVPICYQSPSPRLDSAALQDSFRQLWRLCRLRLQGVL